MTSMAAVTRLAGSITKRTALGHAELGWRKAAISSHVSSAAGAKSFQA